MGIVDKNCKMSKSVVLYGPNDLKLETQEIPIIQNDEVIIRIKSVGLCGSDVVSWKRGGLNNLMNLRPLRLGHEAAGIVEQVGPYVRKLNPGDRVAIEPLICCKECQFCREGRSNICANLRYLGDIDQDGALTEFHVQKASCCFKIPDAMSFDEGALVQPLSIAVGICSRAEISLGQRVLIGGAGVIGIMTLMVAKECGASRICVTDVLKEKVDFAIKMGADCGIVARKGEDPEETGRRVITEFGGMADTSIDCCGFSSSIECLVKATNPGGMLTLVGLGSPTSSILTSNIVWKALNVRGFINTYNCYPKAIELISSGRINVSCLISHIYSIDQFKEAFDNLVSGRGLKTIINI